MVSGNHKKKSYENCKDVRIKPKKMHHKLKKLQKKIEKEYTPTYLSQKDFNDGSYIINKPGHYILLEDIVFDPNPENDYMPYPDQLEYKSSAYFLGFFAAIVIETKNVYLNLNGYSIKQTEAHALQQRFFAIIELASSPFMPGQGPGNFGETIIPAENCIIRNGSLKRSSHHGIHGNLASNILIEDMLIEEFEFIGIALNGGACHVFNKITIEKNHQNVPVLATYSAARFSRLFANNLLTHYSDKLTQEQIDELKLKLGQLELSLNVAFDEIMNTGYTNDKLFRNEERLPDGNIYGLLLHPTGVAVNDFVQPSENLVYNSNNYLNRVDIKNLDCRVDEVIALSNANGDGALVDTAGAVLQIDLITGDDGKYNGTFLSDLQIYMAKLALELGISLGTTNITQDVIDWSENGSDIQELLNNGYQYQLNGDSMFHVNKGAIGYRFGGVKYLTMTKCRLYDLKNQARLANEKLNGNFQAHQSEKFYMGAEVLGINLSSCHNVRVKQFKSKKLFSANGNATGINLMNKTTDVCLDMVSLKNIKAGTLVCKKKKQKKEKKEKKRKCKWMGKNYYGSYMKYTNKVPNPKPQAVGIEICKDCKVNIGEYKICDLRSPRKPVKILRHHKK